MAQRYICFRGTYCVLYHVCHLFWFPKIIIHS